MHLLFYYFSYFNTVVLFILKNINQIKFFFLFVSFLFFYILIKIAVVLHKQLHIKPIKYSVLLSRCKIF